MQISTLYGALLLALTRAVVSQDPNDFSDNCNYASPYPPYRNPEWLCDVCGRDFLRGSAPTVCRPVNATFDDLPAGPVGYYQRINFTNFETVKDAISLPSLPFIHPAVPPNFAKIRAGKTGTLNYAIDLVRYQRLGGFLSSFSYACALPSTRIAVPCVITVKQTQVIGANSNPPFSFETTTTTFQSDGSTGGNLAKSPTIHSGYQQCINATIQAKCTKGGPVDLYIDELLHGIITYRSDDLEG